MPGGSSSDGGEAVPVVRMSWRGFVAEVPRRVRAEWRLKAILALALSTLFCVPYLLLGHFPLMPTWELRLSFIDRWAGFQPAVWVWVYQSVYVLVNAIPLLATRREQLFRYTRGFVLLSLVSFVIFFLLPIRAPKPDVPNPTGMYWLLQLYDADYNSLPSLHAGLLAYTLLFGRRMFRDAALPIGMTPALRVWAILILVATMTTKEHYLLDLVAGVLLGIAADAYVWRVRGRERIKAAAGPLPAES